MTIRELMGYRVWKVWMCDDMHITLLALFYLLLITKGSELLSSLILISSIGFYFMAGGLINDFFDMPHDIAAGKRRPVHDLSRAAFMGIIFSVIFLSALHLVYLKEIRYIIPYIVVYILATLYSAPPVRFKDRKAAGVVVDALIEKTLPVLAVFAFFNHFKLDTLLFLITAFAIQIFAITRHQIQDFDADLRTEVHSYVVDVGLDRAMKVFKNFISPITGITMLALCVFICVMIPHIVIPTIAILAFNATFSYLILIGRVKRKETLSPLYIGGLYVCVVYAFPLILAFLLCLLSFQNIILLLVVLVSEYYVLKQIFESVRKKCSLLEDYVVDR